MSQPIPTPHALSHTEQVVSGVLWRIVLIYPDFFLHLEFILIAWPKRGTVRDIDNTVVNKCSPYL